MADYYLKSGSGVTEFAQSTAYSSGSPGNRIVPKRTDTGSNYLIARRYVWECTTGGTSAAAEPTWPGSVTPDSTTVTSGTAVFTARAPGYSSGSTADWAFAAIYADYLVNGSNGLITGSDRLFVSDNHAESVAATIALLFLTTGSAQMICVDDSAAPPTTPATTATITTTGNTSITVNGNAYIYGINFSAGSGSTTGGVAIASASNSCLELDTCSTKAPGTAGAQNIGYAQNLKQYLVLRNHLFYFTSSAATNRIFVGGCVRIYGCTFDFTSYSPTDFLFSINTTNRGNDLEIYDVDMSNANAACSVFKGGSINSVCRMVASGVRVPASWTGGLLQTAIDGAGVTAEMWHYGNSAVNYRFWTETFLGSCKDDTGVALSSGDGGASDGTNPMTIKMTTYASVAAYPSAYLLSPWMNCRWQDTPGSKTGTLEVIHSGVGGGTSGALLDTEMWAQVQYLGNASYPISSVANDRAAALAAGADQASSSVTWDSSPSTPVKQKLAVSFTDGLKGAPRMRACLAKPNVTVYVNARGIVT